VLGEGGVAAPIFDRRSERRRRRSASSGHGACLHPRRERNRQAVIEPAWHLRDLGASAGPRSEAPMSSAA